MHTHPRVTHPHAARPRRGVRLIRTRIVNFLRRRRPQAADRKVSVVANTSLRIDGSSEQLGGCFLSAAVNRASDGHGCAPCLAGVETEDAIVPPCKERSRHAPPYRWQQMGHSSSPLTYPTIEIDRTCVFRELYAEVTSTKGPHASLSFGTFFFQAHHATPGSIHFVFRFSSVGDLSFRSPYWQPVPWQMQQAVAVEQ